MTPAAVARACRTARPDPPDAELLGRYATGRDPAAFAALVARHGPVVLAACRRVLGPSADADDAFQAVFVGLARRAGAIRGPAALPAWLHRAAVRTAHKLRSRRRRTSPLPDDATDPADPLAEVAWRDVRRVLDEELDRLPAECRGPLVLCLLDGRTRDEAAAVLGCSLATVKRRLEAGRELLRARLLRRGVAPVALAAAALDPTGLRAVVPPDLAASVVRSAARPLPSVAVWVARGLLMVTTAAAVAVGPARSTTALPPPPADHGSRPQDTTDEGLPRGVAAVFGSRHYHHPGRTFATAMSPDGKLLAVADRWSVSVYEAAPWRLLYWLPTASDLGVGTSGRRLVFAPSGDRLGYVMNGDAAFVWDVRTGKLVRQFDGGGDQWRWVGFCAFTPNGRFALSDKNRLYFFDPDSGREVRSTPVGPVVLLSPDGRRFAGRAPRPPRPRRARVLHPGRSLRRHGRPRHRLPVGSARGAGPRPEGDGRRFVANGR